MASSFCFSNSVNCSTLYISVPKILTAFGNINVILTCNRKLSLNYQQLNARGVRSYKDDRRRNSRKHVNELTYEKESTMPRQPLSKNDINAMRRSQVCLFA